MRWCVAYIVGVDIGGTFTDASAIDTADGSVYTAKARTTPEDLVSGLLASLELLAEEVGTGFEDLLARTDKFAHGTTQTSNAMFTWVGATTGLITTRGFRDEILIMRARGRVAGLSLSERRHLRATDKPHRIVPPERIVEVGERVDHRGRVLQALTEAEVERAIRSLVDQQVESIAVSLLWSPEHPEHELLVEKVASRVAPDVHITLSHRLAPVRGEYERTSTAVVNAFVARTMERYLDRLAATLRDRQLRSPLLVLQASGGVVQADDAVAVHTIESGPAAGLVAVAAQAEATGHRNVIATDVGGTTFKVGLVIDGQLAVTQETVVNQYTLLMPMVDLISIGAGGGSIAWTDDTRLRVGPESAGSDPGPACYGWGGNRPTVTDADVVLGFLNPERFLSGRLRLRKDLARAALQPVADRLFGGDVVAAAAGIRTVVDTQMGNLLRKGSLERGHDPRDFVLYAYGGAGPLHATGYARGLGTSTIVVPQAATAFSAYGAAASDIHTSFMRSVRPELLGDQVALQAAYKELEQAAHVLLERQQLTLLETRLVRWADMRYARQLHDVRVTDPAANGRALAEAFVERYRSLYGTAAVLPDVAVELMRIGIDAYGIITKPELPRRPLVKGRANEARLAPREVFWPEQRAWVTTDVYDGVRLVPGSTVGGPAVIEQPGTTIAVPAGCAADVDVFGNTVLTLA